MRCRARSRNRENVPLWVHVLLAAHRSVIALGRSNRLMSGWQPTDPRVTACWYEPRSKKNRPRPMVYFDPPYGIKYGSNFQPLTRRGQECLS